MNQDILLADLAEMLWLVVMSLSLFAVVVFEWMLFDCCHNTPSLCCSSMSWELKRTAVRRMQPWCSIDRIRDIWAEEPRWICNCWLDVLIGWNVPKWLTGVVGLLVVVTCTLLSLPPFKQHVPSLGQKAFSSMSSQNKANSPLTQEP